MQVVLYRISTIGPAEETIIEVAALNGDHYKHVPLHCFLMTTGQNTIYVYFIHSHCLDSTISPPTQYLTLTCCVLGLC